MDVMVRCENCKHPLGHMRSDDDHSGVEIKCQKCGCWLMVSNYKLNEAKSDGKAVLDAPSIY
jgi:hypothetical protein